MLGIIKNFVVVYHVPMLVMERMPAAGPEVKGEEIKDD
jgi:hypothetical protein